MKYIIKILILLSFLITFIAKTDAASYTMNPVWWTAASNDLRIIIWDWWQTQVYYKWLAQNYGWNPWATWNSWPNHYVRLSIWNTRVWKWWTNWTSATTSWSQSGNTYNATTTLTYTTWWRTYRVIIDREYTAPNAYFSWRYRVEVPTWNTRNISFYFSMDSFVAWWDAWDVWYYNTNPSQTVWVYDNIANVLSAQRYISWPTWAWYEASAYWNMLTRINNNQNYNWTIQSTSWDLWYGINRNFWTAAWVVYEWENEWRMLPFVNTPTYDIYPSIWQPEPSLTVWQNSLIPINIINAWTINATWNTTVNFTIPNNFIWPANPFSTNWWSCSAVVWTTVACTKTINITPLWWVDILQIPLKPLAAAWWTTVNFTTSLTNSWDSNTTNNSATISQQVAVSPQVLKLWLDAKSWTNCTTNWCTINSWNDKSWALNNATRPWWSNDTITYSQNRYNFNPALSFDITSSQSRRWLQWTISWWITSNSASVFYVWRLYNNWSTWPRILSLAPDATTADWSANTHFNIARNSWTDTIMSMQNNTMRANLPNTVWSDILASFHYWSWPSSKAYQNWELITNTTHSLTNLNINNYFLWANAEYTHYTRMDLAEIMIFNNDLSLSDRNKIETYLALKYGFTLSQNTPQNYILSDDTIAWNNTIAWIYNRDIAWIWADNWYELYQVKSQSINNDLDIIVEDISLPLWDKQTITWWNNWLSSTTTSSISWLTWWTRINRIWRFQENSGDTGNLRISYKANALPASFTSNIYLWVSNSWVFTNTSTYYPWVYNPSTNSYDFDLNIQNWDYITFARIITDSTPPNINIVFPWNNIIYPNANLNVVINYSDSDSWINSSSRVFELRKWNWSSWWPNIASSFINSNTANLTTANYNLNALWYWRYRIYFYIQDNAWNGDFREREFYIDEPELNVSTWNVNIWNISTPWVNNFSPNIVLTVRTVWTPFNLILNKDWNLAYNSIQIQNWNWVNWVWYEKTPFTNSINLINNNEIIATQTTNLNTSWEKNTYIYTIRLWTNITQEQVAGSYLWNIKFSLELDY